MHRVIDTFRRMDVNGDGRISMEEFRAVLPLLGPPRGAEEAKRKEATRAMAPRREEAVSERMPARTPMQTRRGEALPA